MVTADDVIRLLNLKLLTVEGGYFAEIYRSALSLPNGRCCGTSIYYLLRPGDRSCWHKVTSDEIWYYHAGCPAHQLIVHPDGQLQDLVIGPDILAGHQPQSLIPAGAWQTAILRPCGECDWGLFGAAVFPGFEYQDFTAATDAEMVENFPGLAPVIRQFTHPESVQ